MKGRDLEGCEFTCLDNKWEGSDLEGRGLKGEYGNFVKNTISPKLERFGGKTLVFLPFPFPSLLNK